MGSLDNPGRIHKRAAIISTSVLFALCLISTCARFYVRIRVQKQFSADDGILLFGVLCLICGMSLFYTFVDRLYLLGAVEHGTPGVTLPPDFISQMFELQKLSAVAMILTWCSIVSVKFSYLLLFKRLIDRVRPMVIYWWIVAVFNGMISAYGASVYIAACPDFYDLRSLQCVVGEGLQRSINLSISQMTLDIVGDLLILYIPCRLIWRIKIRWTQKMVLVLSLCLTIITICCTVIRMGGIHASGAVESIDTIWEVYWQNVAANIALTMTAATAFRTFFVAKVKERSPRSPQSKSEWYLKGRRLIRSALSPRSWRFKPSANISSDSGDARVPEINQAVPRGTMTGVMTFINGQGRTAAADDTQYMHTLAEEEYPYWRPASPNSGNAQVIMVQRDLTFRRDDAC